MLSRGFRRGTVSKASSLPSGSKEIVTPGGAPEVLVPKPVNSRYPLSRSLRIDGVSHPATDHPFSLGSRGAGGARARSESNPTRRATASGSSNKPSAETWSLLANPFSLFRHENAPLLWCTSVMLVAQFRIPSLALTRPKVVATSPPLSMIKSIFSFVLVPNTLRPATPVPHTDRTLASLTRPLRDGNRVRVCVSLRRANRARACKRIASLTAAGTTTSCDAVWSGATRPKLPGLNRAGGSAAPDGDNSANARASAWSCKRDVSSSPGEPRGDDVIIAMGAME